MLHVDVTRCPESHKQVSVEAKDFSCGGVDLAPLKVIVGLGRVDCGDSCSSCCEFGSTDVIVLGDQKDRAPVAGVKSSCCVEGCVSSGKTQAIDQDGLGWNPLRNEVTFHDDGFVMAFCPFSSADEDRREVSFLVKLQSTIQAHTESLGRLPVAMNFVAKDHCKISAVKLVGEAVHKEPAYVNSKPQRDEPNGVSQELSENPTFLFGSLHHILSGWVGKERGDLVWRDNEDMLDLIGLESGVLFISGRRCCCKIFRKDTRCCICHSVGR